MDRGRMNFLAFVGLLCVLGTIVGVALLKGQVRPWEELMAKPRLTEQEFTRLFARAVKERYPEFDVKVAGRLEVLAKTPQGEEFRSYLDNAWKQCATEPTTRVSICKERVAVLTQQRGSSRLAPLKDDMGSIIPILKPTDYLDQLLPDKDGTKAFVAEPFVADIWVVYARHVEKGIAFIRPEELADLKLGMAELRALAVKNLRSKLPEVRCYDYKSSVSMIVADGTYEASLLLFDKVWEDMQKKVDGDLIVAVPCRDMLLVTGSDSKNGMTAIRQVVEEAWKKEAYCISRSLLVRRDGKWQVYEGQ